MTSLRTRRASLVSSLLVVLLIVLLPQYFQTTLTREDSTPDKTSSTSQVLATDALQQLTVKGRAAKTGYERAQFGSGWRTENGCDVRNVILIRDLEKVELNDECQVLSGVLYDPYTAKEIKFKRGPGTSSEVQIDHVIALSNAWQTGAQQLEYDERIEFANDPLNLLAVDGPANQQKGDSDAATWLPSNKPFRCQYVARQIAIKQSYQLWVTPAEKSAMVRVLQSCPEQKLPAE